MLAARLEGERIVCADGSALSILDLIRVPFLDKGQDDKGWDCLGCCTWLTGRVFGMPVQLDLSGYTTTDWRAAKQLAAALQGQIDQFETCAPAFGAWLGFRRFGAMTHLGFALNDHQFIHADDAGEVGGQAFLARAAGTYVEDYVRDERWASRLVEIRRPIVQFSRDVAKSKRRGRA